MQSLRAVEELQARRFWLLNAAVEFDLRLQMEQVRSLLVQDLHPLHGAEHVEVDEEMSTQDKTLRLHLHHMMTGDNAKERSCHMLSCAPWKCRQIFFE